MAADNVPTQDGKSQPKGGAKLSTPGPAAQNLDKPRIRWRIVAQVAVGFVVLWVLAVMLMPYAGWWSVGVTAVLTLVALGFGLHVWRLTRKSAGIAEILQRAQDSAGRQQALAKLSERADSGDALNALARAQLVAAEKPTEALRILEAVDLKKAPGVVQDDVRANLAMLYLAQNRVREARPLVAEIKINRQPQPKAKAMYAAVMAETQARSAPAKGSQLDEALRLLETYDADDAAYAEARPLLLRASVFVFHAAKKRGRMQKSLESLAAIDPMMLGQFVQKGAPPEVARAVRPMLSRLNVMPKPKMRMRMQ